MTKKRSKPFAVHPGKILKTEFMGPRGLSAYALAKALDFPGIYEVVRGDRAISADTATRLGKYFSMPAHFWLNLQNDYDLRVQSKRHLFDTVGIHGTVVLNEFDAPEREYTWYGEAFHEAGKSLVKQLKNDPQFGLSGPPPDSFKAIPIVYLYRHAMELYLKGVILAGDGVLPLRGEARVDRKALFDTHALQPLLRDVERIFKAFGWGWDFESTRFRSLADFRSVVGQLDNVKSDVWRYPSKKDGKSHVLKRHFRFNLFEFCEALDPVYPVLDGAASGAQERLQQEYENDAEARQHELENADIWSVEP